MATNEFLAFATAPGANVQSQNDYLADAIVPSGFATGLLPSAKTNKVWRQSSFVASSIAHLIYKTLDVDVLDDGDVGVFSANLAETIQALAGGSQGVPIAPTDGAGYGMQNGSWVRVLLKSGDTLSGPLSLAGPPTQPMGAVNKGYVDGLASQLAPLLSPIFTGTPRAPTAPVSTNTTQLATTAFVIAQVAASVSGVSNLTAGAGLTGGGTGNVTLSVANAGITTAMLAQMPPTTVKANLTGATSAATDATLANLTTAMGVAPLASPSFTGVPTAPTAAAGTASNQLASTGFVSNGYLKLSGGTLTAPAGTSNPLYLTTQTTQDNYIAFIGSRTYLAGVGSAVNTGCFAIYDSPASAFRLVIDPTGKVSFPAGSIFSGVPAPADFSMGSGSIINLLNVSSQISFNYYYSTGGITRYIGNATAAAIYVNPNTPTMGFYFSQVGAAGAPNVVDEWFRISDSRALVTGTNSPGFTAVNTSGGGPFGWSNSSSNMNFGLTNAGGNITSTYGYFSGADGTFNLAHTLYANNGLYSRGNDVTYVDGAGTGNARIYYVNNTLTWLVGCRADNGNFTWQNVTASYAERLALTAAGDFYINSGSLHAVAADNRLWRTFFSWDVIPDGNNKWSVGNGINSWAAVNAYSINNLSSRAEKIDIAPAPVGALDKVNALGAMDFRWRENPQLDPQHERMQGPGKLHRGFIADEVATVFGEDWGGYNKSEDSAHESIAYHELVAVLWQAVQELSAQVKELQH